MVVCDLVSDGLRTSIERHHFGTKVIFVDTKKKAEMLTSVQTEEPNPSHAFNFSKKWDFDFGATKLRETVDFHS
jgi:hypothetical protein